MIKLMFMMKRKDEISLEDFKKWLLEDHAVIARKLSGVKSYTVNPLLKDDPDALYDAITALHFESETAMADAFAGEAGKAAGNDVAEHCSHTSRMVCEEKQLV